MISGSTQSRIYLLSHIFYLADVSTSKHECSSYQHSLTLEQQQNSVLKAKVETLGDQLSAQKKDFSDALHLERQVQEGMEASEKQKVQDMSTLKTKV